MHYVSFCFVYLFIYSSTSYINPNLVKGPDVDDLSVEIKGCTLNDVTAILKNPPAKYQPYSLLMVNFIFLAL